MDVISPASTGTGGSSCYVQDDVKHDSDFETPLHHGIIRYVPAPHLSAEVKSTYPIKSDRDYVYVPAGYLNREDKFVTKILDAMGLKVPNLVVVVAATEGTREEQMAKFAARGNVASSLGMSETELENVLQYKVEQMLQSAVECCVEIDAWLMPDDPRRRNGGAQMLCSALKSSQAGTPIALGIIGLDDQDEEEGFTESIHNSMVPVGSPPKSVSLLNYDPDVKDGAPCSDLTHLLIFESPHEMDCFKEALLAIIPDLLLAFGNITDDAMQTVYDYADDGNPIVLLKHTGKRIDDLSSMFQHIENELNNRIDDQSTKGGMEIMEDKVRIPPMSGMEDKMINRFISTWPADFESDSIFLADPIILDGTKLQERTLKVITASFDLQQGNSDLQRARKKALDYGWSFHNITEGHCDDKKRAAELLHIELVFSTLLSIVISVLYDQAYGDGGSPNAKDPFQIVIFVSTILLPLIISSLKRETETNNPAERWATFKVATAKTESEIYKFRAQVGPYRPLEKSQSAMRKPLNKFVTETRVVWSGIRQYLADENMPIPSDFWDMGSPVEYNGVQKQMEFNNIGSPPLGNGSEYLETSSRMAQGKLPVSSTIPHDVEDPLVHEKTPILPKSAQFGKGSESEDDNRSTLTFRTASPRKPTIDNGYSPLNAEQYLETRMKTQMTIKSEELARMTTRNQRVSNTIKGVTIFSGATAALSLQWTVPIILGVTAAFGSVQDFRRYNHRIEVANSMIVQLNELKLWWMGLSMYQQQLPHNKDRLVLQAEKIILSEVTAAHDVSAKVEEYDGDK